MMFDTFPASTEVRKVGRTDDWTHALKKAFREAERSVQRLRASRQARVISKAIRSQSRSDLRVAIRIDGGIGDHVVAVRFLRDLLAEIGPLALDIYSTKKGAAAWLFGSLDASVTWFDEWMLWDRVYKAYPLSLYLTQFVEVPDDIADWRRLADASPKLFEISQNIVKFRPRINACMIQHPDLDGQLGRIATSMGLDRRTFLQGMANIRYGGDSLPIEVDGGALRKFGLLDRPFVTIHNGFDPEFKKHSQESTKVYPRFDEVVRAIKNEFPEFLVVQIGTVTSKSIDAADIDLIGATNLKELAAIIARSVLNIDNESGIVHLARCFDVPSCVVFGPTSLEYFSYPGNINVAPPVCGGCWWVNKTWMTQCAKGYAQPPCMALQPPEAVVEALRGHLRLASQRLAAGSNHG